MERNDSVSRKEFVSLRNEMKHQRRIFAGALLLIVSIVLVSTQDMIFRTKDSSNTSTTRISVSNGANTATIKFSKSDLQLENSGTGQTAELRFMDTGSNYVGFKAPNSATTTVWTLPNADGSAGQVLTTDGGANLSWQSLSGVSVTSLNTATGAVTIAGGNGNSVSNAGSTITINGPQVSGGVGLLSSLAGTTWTIDLQNTSVSPGTYGSANQVGIFTVDAQGRITSASNVTVSGTIPGGVAGGDLSGTYPNPTVLRVNGTAFADTTAANANILVANGTSWFSKALSGDATINNNGLLSLGTTGVIAGSYTRANITVDSKGRITSASNGAAVNLGTEVTGTLGIANGGTGATTAAAALSNLGAAAAAHTHAVGDLTQGTATSGQVLKFNGTAWAPGTDNNNSYVAGTGISIAGLVISNTGDTNFADDLTDTTAFAGDISGTASAISVTRIQGVGISATAPTAGQVLMYDSISTLWEPANAANGTVTSVATGAGLAGGTITTSGTISIATGGVTNAMLTNSDITVTAGSGLSGGGLVSLGGTVSLTNAGVLSVTASGVISSSGGQNPNITLTGIVPIANGGTGASTAAAALSNLGAAAATHTHAVGDLTQGTAVSGQVLKFNGTAWAPGADNDTTYTAGTGISIAGTTISNTGDTNAADDLTTSTTFGGDVSGTASAISVTRIQGTSVSATSPTSGQVLKFNGTNWAAGADSDTTYTNGAGLNLTGTTFSVATGGVTNAMLMNSDITVAAGSGLSGGGLVSLGGSTSISLANTAVTPATYGSATQVAQFTVDAQGRLTAAGNVTISGVAPGGSAGGDLSGTYPNPTVAKINGVALGSTTATGGNLLIADGVAWTSAAMSGDATIASAGALTLANTGVSAGAYTRANITVDAKGRITLAANGAAVNLASEVSGTLPVANGGTGATIPSTARTNLGAAASGGNADITVMTALTAINAAGNLTIDMNQVATTTLSVTNGDTGNVANLSVEGTVSAAMFSGDGSGLSNVTATSAGANSVNSAAIVDGSIVNVDISASAGITVGKLGASGATGGEFLKYNGTAWAPGGIVGGDIPTGAITTSHIFDGTIANIDISATAAIDVSKFGASGATGGEFLKYNGTAWAPGGIVSADIPTDAITSSKILDGSIVNADISASAAITVDKLGASGATSGQFLRYNGTAWAPGGFAGADIPSDSINSSKIIDGGILDADISLVAAIQLGKLATGGAASGDFMRYNGTAWAAGQITSLTTLNQQAALGLNPFGAGAGNTSEIRFLELAANGTNYTGFKAADNLAVNTVWTLPAADGTAGQVLKTDGAGNLSWVTAGGTGTVTSVGLSMPAIFSVVGSPITTSGTLSVSFTSESANTVFAGPDGAAGAPTFRALVAADIPNLDAAKITSGSLALARGGTGTDLTGTGGPGQYLKQISLGAAITVGTIPAGDIPDLSATYVTLSGGQVISGVKSFNSGTLKVFNGPNTFATTLATGASTPQTITFPDTSDTVVVLSATQMLTNKNFADSLTFFVNNTDNSKKLKFDLSGITPATTRTLTVPNVDDTIATIGAAQTLANKTFSDISTFFEDNTDPSRKAQFELASIAPATTRTYTLPDTSDTFVMVGLAQTLANKSFSDISTYFEDNTDPSRKAQLELSSIAPATTRTYSLPNTSDTFVMVGFAQTLANKSFSDISTWFEDNTDPSRKAQFELSSIAPATTRTYTLPDTSDTFAMVGLAQTLANKTFSDISTWFEDNTDPSKKAQFEFASIAPATTRTYTFPNASGTVALTGDLGAYVLKAGDTMTGTLTAGAAIAMDSVGGLVFKLDTDLSTVNTPPFGGDTFIIKDDGGSPAFTLYESGDMKLKGGIIEAEAAAVLQLRGNGNVDVHLDEDNDGLPVGLGFRVLDGANNPLMQVLPNGTGVKLTGASPAVIESNGTRVTIE